MPQRKWVKPLCTCSFTGAVVGSGTGKGETLLIMSPWITLNKAFFCFVCFFWVFCKTCKHQPAVTVTASRPVLEQTKLARKGLVEKWGLTLKQVPKSISLTDRTNLNENRPWRWAMMLPWQQAGWACSLALVSSGVQQAAPRRFEVFNLLSGRKQAAVSDVVNGGAAGVVGRVAGRVRGWGEGGGRGEGGSWTTKSGTSYNPLFPSADMGNERRWWVLCVSASLYVDFS